MAKGELSGLKILVTRPRDQAAGFAQGIAEAGGIPVLLPLLEINPVENGEVPQPSDLASADLVVFISPNAVKYGLTALPPGLKIAAVGAGSARALKEAGVADVLVPAERFDSEGLLAELPQVAGWRVVIFRGDGGRELLGDTLRARGAQVEYVTCYRRSKPPLDMNLLQSADLITVTSSEAMGYLSEITPERATPLFAPHPRIAELARLQGWADVHQTGAGDEGLLAGLIEWAKVRMQDAGFRIQG